MNPSDMNTIGSKRGLTVKVTEPFDRAGTPTGLGVNLRFSQQAFRLRPDEPFAGPLEGDEHVYVIALDARFPSTNAEFEAVKEQVAADYRLEQARSNAWALGQSFARDLTNRLALGKTFAEACAEAGHKPLPVGPFSRNTRSLPEIEERVALTLFKQVAFETPLGQASRFNPTTDGGYLAYVESRLPIEEAKMKEALPEYTRLVREALESEVYSIWFTHEAQVGLRETPLALTPPPGVSVPGG